MKKLRGFTLLELLIVIGIMGILAALGMIVYGRLNQSGRDTRRKADIQAVATAIDQYYLNNDQTYPASNSCDGVETYLQDQRMPIDPKNIDSYVYSWTNSCDQAAAEFCVCALMEIAGSGNAGAQCDYQAAEKDYFCVNNKQ